MPGTEIFASVAHESYLLAGVALRDVPEYMGSISQLFSRALVYDATCFLVPLRAGRLGPGLDIL